MLNIHFVIPYMCVMFPLVTGQRSLVFDHKRSTNLPATVQANYTICWILEEDSFYSTYERLVAAVDLAITHANDFILPKSVKLQLVYQSAGPSCSDIQYSVTANVLKMLQSGVTCDVFLGVGCPTTAVALYGIASHLDVLILGCPAAGTGSLALNPAYDTFPLLLRPSFGFADVAHFLNAFLTQNRFAHLAILRDDSFNFYTFLSQFVVVKLRKSNPSLFSNTLVYPFFSTSTNLTAYKHLVQTCHDATRVMFLLAHAKAVRQIMIAASQLGFTDGEYLFIAVELFELDYWGTIRFDQGDTYDDVARQAFKSLMVMSLRKASSNSDLATFEDKVKQLSRSTYNYTFRSLEKLDPIIFAHYESISMYSQELAIMAKNNIYKISGSAMLNSIIESEYRGIAGPMRISKDGERHNNMELQTFNAKSGEFDATFEYIQINFTAEIFRYVKNLTWPSHNGNLPLDEPACGFRGEKCTDKNIPASVLTFSIAIPLALVVILSGTGLFAFVKLRKLREDYNPNWWRINTDELVRNKQLERTKSCISRLTLPSLSTADGDSNSCSGFSSEIPANYKGGYVSLTDVIKCNKHPSADIISKLSLLKICNSSNLQKFIGLALNSTGLCEFIVNEYCSKGSLTCILDNEMIKLDWSFKNSLIKDIVYGMMYLHEGPIKSHGNLTSHSCRVDAKFTLKIGDYGLPFFRDPADLQPPRPSDDSERCYATLLWRAPELLRQTMPPEGTQKGDVYSFAIILQQIILRSGAYELPNDPLELSDRDIIEEVIAANIPPVRPRVPRAACSNELYDLMERCWEEMPLGRPTFFKIKEQLRRITGDVGDNIVEVLFKRMEQYASDLEKKVAEKTQQFMEEKMRSEQLLSQLLPKSVAAALTRGEHIDPEAYESVSIFFSDIVGFTTISAAGSPMDVVGLLNGLYTFFDGVLEKFDVYKVETIGDAYMVSSGLPVRNGNKHASEIASMALTLLDGIRLFVVPNRPNVVLEIRAGINSGPCVAGIVGLKMPRYCVFGDTVNVASRMESTGEPMKIQITEATHELLTNVGGFIMTERGTIAVKGKGMLTTYWLKDTEKSK